MVSFANPDQIALAAEVCQSFALDNGAFSAWRGGASVDVKGFVEWVGEWARHPGFDWAVIPDVIDGSEQDNDQMFAEYRSLGGDLLSGVPVWHLHESLERLRRLCQAWPRVALGSSGIYSDPGRADWWARMSEAMDFLCDEQGRPPAKLHGLRMLDPTIFSQLPLASADSVAVARNIGIDSKWTGAYAPKSKETRALILADRIEHHGSAARWENTMGTQQNLGLYG